MIYAFVGTPGSGKSYDAVKKVLDNVKRGTRVYTNIEGLDQDEQREFIKIYAGLDDCQLAERLVYVPNNDMLRFWEFVEHNSLIVIDEVHRLFSNRSWDSASNKAFADWASVHRHYGFNVVLITQDIEKVDKHVRSLVEWSYYYRKVNFFGSLVSNRYLRYTYSGDDHHGQAISKEIKPYEKHVFRCYKSFDAKDITESGIMQGVNILKHPIFYAIPVVICALLYFGSKSSLATGDIFGTKKAQKQIAKKQAQVFHPAAVSAPAPASPAADQRPAPTQDTPQCLVYKVRLDSGVTALVSDLPAVGHVKVLKCFGQSKAKPVMSGREG